MKRKQFALVYQGGLANLFEIDDFTMSPLRRYESNGQITSFYSPKNPKLLFQGDYTRVSSIALGLKIGGHYITTLYCGEGSNIKNSTWNDNWQDFLFRDKVTIINS